MPRPGPRPYEFVRRAWHSDAHHPIRGSLIQEIFRIVNEVHSSATKKNKEWQKNLPIVVLKAEEILYSKANSEAEYSNLKTLWHRVNDAIDNIIRRDESSETGELLQPCIEDQLQFDDPKFSLKQPSNSYSHPTKNDKTRSIQNRSSCKPDSPKITLPVKLDSNNPSDIQCDLSLRLGSPSVSCTSMENGCPQEEENGNLGNAREGRSQLSEDFSFFAQAKNKQVCWQLSLNSMKE